MRALLLALLLAGSVLAADRTATPSDAVGWAIADLVTLPEADRPWQRYLWIPPWGTGKWHGAISWATQIAANRSSLIRRPAIIANGWLMRWDLRELAPNDAHLAELATAWDSLAADEPYFHVAESAQPTGKAVALVAPHIEPSHAQALASLNASPALVYRADWFLARALSTVDGGVYYELRGIRPNPDRKRTDQDRFLAMVGAFEELSADRDGDMRVAMFRSRVTGKPRRVEVLRGVGGRSSSGFVWVTRDQRDQDVTADRHPIYNLLDLQDAAREVIAEGPNGLHLFGLFDASGRLQREVPPDIANDHTIPAPHTRRLQGAISCIRCHGADSGLKEAPNEVARLLSGRLDAIGDLGFSDQRRAVDRLAGLYAGDFADWMTRSRNDYEKATFRATGGMSVPEVSELVSEIYAGLQFELVDAARAQRELGGVSVDQLLDDPEQIPGVAFEDPSIAALREGLEIRRQDFERIYADLMRRRPYPLPPLTNPKLRP